MTKLRLVYADFKQSLKVGIPKPELGNETTYAFLRNPDVISERLFLAKGICDLCKKPTPFKKATDGNPYLEVHHIKSLASGGDDTVENTHALYPNCHRKSHFGVNTQSPSLKRRGTE